MSDNDNIHTETKINKNNNTIPLATTIAPSDNGNNDTM